MFFFKNRLRCWNNDPLATAVQTIQCVCLLKQQRKIFELCQLYFALWQCSILLVYFALPKKFLNSFLFCLQVRDETIRADFLFKNSFWEICFNSIPTLCLCQRRFRLQKIVVVVLVLVFNKIFLKQI